MTRHYHVSLVIEVLACLRINDGYPNDAISMIARESISLLPTGQEDVTLEIEHIEVNDIVEITQETNDAG